MMPVTVNFTVDEFGCRDGNPYPAPWIFERLKPLCETLEIIRAAAGGTPIHINSGYRTFAYDQKLYDADAGRGNVAPPQGSQHPQGRAADITHGKLTPVLLHALILQLSKAGKLPLLGGLGLYQTFVHVDIRERVPAGHLAQWSGTRTTNVV